MQQLVKGITLSQPHTDQEATTFSKRSKSSQDEIITLTLKAAWYSEVTGPVSFTDSIAGPKSPVSSRKSAETRAERPETLTLQRGLQSEPSQAIRW